LDRLAQFSQNRHDYARRGGDVARLVADQLGHSRASMTQDVYMGRRVVDSQAALALDPALRDGRFCGKTLAKEEGQRLVRALSWVFVRHQGLEPRTR
jgi:hypothetical protein